MATADSIVRARIDAVTKQEATAVLAQMGLSVSDAIRLMLVRVAHEHALPFDVRVPNAETIAAIREGEQGEVRQFQSTADLLTYLNADD